MELIKTEEITENEVIYIVNTYDNGTVEKYIKPDPDAVTPEPEPQEPPVTNKDLDTKMDSLEQQLTAVMLGMVDMYSAITENK